MRILLTGASGLVGSYLLKFDRKYLGLARKRPSWLRSENDFITQDAFSISEEEWGFILSKVDTVVFLAFPTHLDSLERISVEDELALINGFQRFVTVAKTLNKPVLFFSSDAVLWGIAKTKRMPGMIASHPINRYSALKIACESVLLKANISGSYILRCIPVGIHSFQSDHGFVGSMLAASLRNPVIGFSDVEFNPVSLPKISNLIDRWAAHLAKNEANCLGINPIIHAGSQDSISKFNFLKPLVDSCNGKINSGSFANFASIARRVDDQWIGCSSIPGFDPFSASEVQIDVLDQLKSTSEAKGLA